MMFKINSSDKKQLILLYVLKEYRQSCTFRSATNQLSGSRNGVAHRFDKPSTPPFPQT